MTNEEGLDLFVTAQEQIYARALGEIRRGKKCSHWMWFIFPQLAGLGRSATSKLYGLAGADEARAYLAHRLGFRQVRSLANIHGAAIVGARGDVPYDCVEDVWRRAGVPRAAIERIAEADGFASLSEDRRQGLWKVRGLGEAPLPLFAAADAREANFSPEGLEPPTALRPMTEGREVVEDYRTLQLSLRAHPLSFLR